MEKIRPQTARQPKKSIIADQSRPKTAHADRRVSFHFPERDRFVTTPEPLLDLDLTDYEPIPQNPSIMIKKERPRSCPPSTRTVLPLKAYIPPTSLKTQTVRTNLEKFQIETVFLFH
jgi:hypothetical protein